MDLLQEIPGSVSLATLTCIHTLDTEAEQLQMGDAISCGD